MRSLHKYLAYCGLFFLLLLSPVSGQELLLFGGPNHDVFLGSLTAPSTSADSVWNEFGKYGNEFRSECIWNQFGPYGNEFKSSSPWNEFASGSSTPVIVDRTGKFYGHFTANKFNPKRTRIESLVWLLDHKDYVLKNLAEIRQRF